MWLVLLGVVAMLAALTVTSFAVAGRESPQLTKVTLQSKWVVQSQFAGYYAAKAKGFYKAQGLDVNIKVGGPTIIPEQVVLGTDDKTNAVDTGVGQRAQDVVEKRTADRNQCLDAG